MRQHLSRTLKVEKRRGAVNANGYLAPKINFARGIVKAAPVVSKYL
jgi:hypothetical protein